MLKYKVGNLIEAALSGEVNIIAQCCNCLNKRKSGIAPLIDKAFPEAGEADDSTIKGDPHKFGKFSSGYNEEFDLFIYNLYGQFGFSGRYQGKIDVNYEKLESSLRLMADEVNAQFYASDLAPMPHIGIPLIGCGLAGGDWKIVSKMIENTLCKVAHVTVYVLKEDTLKEILNEK